MSHLSFRRIPLKLKPWLIFFTVLVLSVVALGLTWQQFSAGFYQPPLAQDSSIASDSMLPAKTSQLPLRYFQVTVRGGMTAYRTLDADIRDDGNQVEFILTIEPNGSAVNPNPTRLAYRATIPQQNFDSFWQELESLNAGKLPNTAPEGNQPGRHLQSPSVMVIDAPTYSFFIHDRQSNINHQFYVYAPDQVVDLRYRSITTKFYTLLNSVFGDRPFQNLGIAQK